MRLSFHAAAAFTIACALILAAPLSAEARPPVAPPGEHSFVLWHDVSLPAGVRPAQLTVGATGVVWFFDDASSVVESYDPVTGVVAAIPATAGSFVHTLVESPDGRIWFSDPVARDVVSIDPVSRSVERHAVPLSLRPTSLTVAPDGSVWFGAASPGTIGRITVGGAAELVPLSGTAEAQDVAWGADGRVWASQYGASAVVAYDPVSHTETRYPVPTAFAFEIEAATDGSLWLPSGSSLIRLDTGGAVRVLPAPPAPTGTAAFPFSLRTGAGSAVLVYADSENRIVAIGPDGSASVAGPSGQARSIQAVGVGPEGSVWFSDALGGSLGWG